MKPVNRPLSPHLQVYSLPLTALLSISHRITGIVLVLGMVILTIWISSAAIGEAEYNYLNSFINFWLGRLVLLGFSFALFYHLSNGLRHLFWDMGKNFDLITTQKADFTVLFSSVCLTVITWFAALWDLF
jgi:succinate dehydrogenase / fumarate reductase cytochrome b subunit